MAFIILPLEKKGMNNKLKKNYFYILAYQMLTVLTPLFTTPYISRVLGPEMIGLDAYIGSIVQLFTLVIILATPMYASKQLAQAPFDKHQQIFSEMFSIQLIMTLITILGYLIFVLVFSKYNYLFILYIYTIISTGIDTSWYFVGKESIANIMVRNISVRIITVLLIFMFVKTTNDLSVYILISGLSLLVGQLITGRIAIKDVGGFKFTTMHFFSHLRPILILFIVPSVTVISLSINKILLESFNGEIEVGFFNQSYKLYMMVISFVSALTSVLMPRMSRYFADQAHEKVREYLHFSICFILMTALPVTGGIIAVSKRFIPWFLGEDYVKVAPVLTIVAISFAFKGLVDVFGIQYLLISNRNREYAFAIIIGSLLSTVSCYYFLLGDYKAKAPAIGLVVGTFITLIVELMIARKGYSFTFLIRKLVRYGSCSLVMMLGMIAIGERFSSIGTFNILIIQSVTGIGIYLFFLIISRDDNLQSLLKKRKKSV